MARAKRDHSTGKQRPTALQMANEMYKQAFQVKKQKFSEKHPELSEAELHKKTARYFRDLPKD